MSTNWPTAEQFDKAAELGTDYALAERRNGATEAREAPLSGEWAGDPTERTIAASVGFIHEDDFEPEALTEIGNAWERAYFDTWAHEDDVQAEEDGEAG